MSIILSPQDMAEYLKPSARLLGLDLGTKTIGIAMAVLSIGIATPFFTIRRIKFQLDAQALMATVRKEQIDALVLGMPFHMDGSEGRRAQSTRAFVRNLAAFSAPPVLFWDERLSSAAADDRLIEAGVSHSRRETMIDAIAAQFILQDAIDGLKALTRERFDTSE
ncbi:MAG: Holliday junction resolvase RuvX [Beijerinckiaceae bacterium]